MEFYILKKHPHLGPYSITQLDEFLQEEKITGEDFYWHEGMNSWLPLAKFPGYIPPPTAPPPPPEHLVRQLPSPAVSKPASLPATDDPATARLRPEELRARSAPKPSPQKKAATEKLRKHEARPPFAFDVGRLKAAARPVLAAVLFLAMAFSAYFLFQHYADAGVKPATNLLRKIATIEDARNFVCGTWTYIGSGTGNTNGRAELWEKFVIKPDGAIDMYSAMSGDQNWGTPITESYNVVTGRVAGSGTRVFGIQVAKYDMKIIITARGTLRETTADRDVELFRGDRNPFAK